MVDSTTFASLSLLPSYNSERGTNRDILTAFYIPVLARAVEYNCVAGYFRSSFISSAAAGVSHFIHNGGRMKLLLNAELEERDINALTGEVKVDGAFAERLRLELVPTDEVRSRRLAVLAWLYNEGRLDVRVAIPYRNNLPVLANKGEQVPIQHAKYGYFVDDAGGRIAFNGSVNVSQTALESNNEDITVFQEGDRHLVDRVEQFWDKWQGHMSGFRVIPLPAAVRDQLLTLVPPEAPPVLDALETPPENECHADNDPVAARAAFVRYAPRFPDAAGIAEATSGITLQPHQRQAAYRLADQYPRSWIVADEVGLGKTISAGISLRRLILAGQVKRALIVAPANLRQNWQSELFEKFGLWVPRLVDGAIVSPDPKVEPKKIPAGTNPFSIEPFLIVSSHLARRIAQANQLLEAARQQTFDLIIVDEAHHARYKGGSTTKKQERNRLLALLQNIQEQRAARALWLLTATPLQTSVTDLHALLSIVGLEPPFDDIGNFERYYQQLVAVNPDWRELQRLIQQFRVDRDLDPDEVAYLEHLRSSLLPSQFERIRTFTDGSKGIADTVESPTFDDAARAALRQWLRLHGPVERHMTRHTRETLRSYQRRGLISQSLAKRDVSSPNVDFSSRERELLDRLDGYIARFEATIGSDRNAAFVLEIYRQRLTSSWAAIERSLQSRLDRTPLSLDDADTDDAEDADHVIDHAKILPLTGSEADEIREYIQELRAIQNIDSKFTLLERCISEARNSGRRIIIFTQFTDTLNYLLEKIRPTYHKVLATYTGDGGRIFEDNDVKKVSKSDLVEAVRSQRVQIVLATDAAAEGLNLQTCSYLVNFDMPWNPMRVEQRIGRIDRLGQAQQTVIIKNFFVTDAERGRYRALADRIRDFNTYIGGLPPILGVVEDAFVPRPYVEQQTSLEDQLPVPVPGHAPLSYDDFTTIVRDELHALAEGSNATWDLTRASADPENWAALATYGHPDIDSLLAKVPTPKGLAVATDASGIAVLVRCDGVKPTIVPVLDDLASLGAPVQTDEAAAVAAEALRTAIQGRQEKAAGLAFQGRADARLEVIRVELIALIQEAIGATMSYANTVSGVPLRAGDAYERLSHTQTGPLLHAMTLAHNLGVPRSEFETHQSLTHLTKANYHSTLEKLERRSTDLISRYVRLSTDGDQAPN